MKSFFKKLSLVLVAAMVITMLPAQSAKAATKITLGIKGQKEAALANTAQTYEMKVGEKQLWAFWGVDSYNTAGGKTKNWTSSNPAVATVANGEITAVAAGKTKITLTLTNNGIDYIGQADLTVVAKDAAPVAGAPVVNQVSYQSVEITFADADAAKAAVDAKISVTRVRTDKNGKELYLYCPAKAEQNGKPNKNIVTVSGLSNGVTYKISIPGYAQSYKVTMNVGDPVAVKLTYPTVYISGNDKVSTDISGVSIKSPEVTPVAQVVDANGIICESTASGFKFTTDKAKNVGNPAFTPTNGRIRFNKLDSTCYVKCEYSYKNSEGKTIPCDYDEVTVSPVPYTAPNFQGFVEKITLTDESGKEVEYPNNYSYTASLAIGQSAKLAFYFETPDGDKYAPGIVYNTVRGAGLKEDKSYNLIKAEGKAYNYYVEVDDPTKSKISINAVEVADGKGYVEVRGFEEGIQTVCVYEYRVGADDKDNTKDKLVGILTITVEPKAEIVDLHLSDNSVTGFRNTEIEADRYQYIGFKLEDQYGDNTVADLKIRDENGGLPAGVSFVKTDKTTVPSYSSLLWRSTKEGYIKVDLTTFGLADNKVLYVSVDDQADRCVDSIYVTSKDIDLTKATSFALMASDKNLKNKHLYSTSNANLATNLSLNINVVRTKGGERFDCWAPFYIVGDDDISKVKGDATMKDQLLVWITKEDGSVLKKTVNGKTLPLASEIGTCDAEFHISATSTDGYKLDLIRNATTNVNLVNDETFLKGKFTISLYVGNDGQRAPSFKDSIEVTINDEGITRISQVDTRYQLKVSDADTDKGLPAIETSNNEKVKSWTGAHTQSVAEGLTTQFNMLVMEIVKSLYVWVDLNSDGKCYKDDTFQYREVTTIGNLIGTTNTYCEDCDGVSASADGSGFVPYSLKYVKGAEDSKEIYISSVTLRFRLGGVNGTGALVEQTLNLNTKYEFE